MNYGLRRCLAAMAFFAATASQADIKPPMYIVAVRSYVLESSSGYMYITVENNSVCSTTVFQLDFSIPGSREAAATALTALVANKQVGLEIFNNKCDGYGTKLRSITIYQ